MFAFQYYNRSYVNSLIKRSYVFQYYTNIIALFFSLQTSMRLSKGEGGGRGEGEGGGSVTEEEGEGREKMEADEEEGGRVKEKSKTLQEERRRRLEGEGGRRVEEEEGWRVLMDLQLTLSWLLLCVVSWRERVRRRGREKRRRKRGAPSPLAIATDSLLEWIYSSTQYCLCHTRSKVCWHDN